MTSLRLRSVLALAALLSLAAPAAEPAEVLFSFDAEDFTSPASADGVLELARLFTQEGVVGHFALVGYMASSFVERGRTDVIEALKPHLVMTHTLSHSVHPNLMEASDLEDYSLAHDAVLAREAEALGMIKAATGAGRVWGAVPPGNSDSYVAYYVYAELGIRYFCGASFASHLSRDDFWFCNLRHVPYGLSWEEIFDRGEKFDADAFLDRLAKTRRSFVYCHPNKVHAKVFWDELNYKGRNLREWGRWELSPRRPDDEANAYLEKIRELLRRIKGDPRFRITTLAEIDKSQKPRRAMSLDDVPSVRASLERSFGPVREPGSWSLSDCFLAAVHFLRGGKSFAPGMAYGFLSRPIGVAEPVKVRREDLVAAAKEMDVSRFLPASIRVGSVEIGPADFLMAALEVLATGADEATVTPRDQLGGFGPIGRLSKLRFAGTWLHSPQFEDKYLSERMRLQIWTLRYE